MSRSSRVEVTEFTVTYLGSEDCRALRGEDVTEPVVKTFIYGDRRDITDEAPKSVLLAVGLKNVILTEIIQKKKKVEKKRLMSMSTHDVTYAASGFPPNNDVLVAIVLGHNAKPRYVVRAHVFTCDSTEVASKIVALFMRAASSVPARGYVSKVEDDLVRRKLVERSVDPSLYTLTFPVHQQLRASASAAQQPVRTSTVVKTMSNAEQSRSDDLYQKKNTGTVDATHHDRQSTKVTGGMHRTKARAAGGEPPVDYSDEEKEEGTLKQKQRPEVAKYNVGALSTSVIHDTDNEDVFDAMESIKVLDDVLMQVPQSRESQSYDNVTNELRRKLGKGQGQGQGHVTNDAVEEQDEGPLLLPPKDYDTMHRQHGKLNNIDERRSRNTVIVGDNRADVWQPEIITVIVSKSDPNETGRGGAGKVQQASATTAAAPLTTPGHQQHTAAPTAGKRMAPLPPCNTTESDFVQSTAATTAGSSPRQLTSDARRTLQTVAPLARSSPEQGPPYTRQKSRDATAPMPTSAAGWRRMADNSGVPVMNLRATYHEGGEGKEGNDYVTRVPDNPPHYRQDISPPLSYRDVEATPSMAPRQMTAAPVFTRQTSSSSNNNNRSNGNNNRVTVMDINYSNSSGNIHRRANHHVNGKRNGNDELHPDSSTTNKISHTTNASRDSNYHSNTSEDEKCDSPDIQKHPDGGSLSLDSRPSSSEFHLPRASNQSHSSKRPDGVVYGSASNAVGKSDIDDYYKQTDSRNLAVDNRNRGKAAWNDRDRDDRDRDDRDKIRGLVDNRDRRRGAGDIRNKDRDFARDRDRRAGNDRDSGRGPGDERNREQQTVYYETGYKRQQAQVSNTSRR